MKLQLMKCPLCGDTLLPTRRGNGLYAHEYQTACAFVSDELSETQIAVLRDAALGRALRRLPAWSFLYQNSVGWFYGTEMSHGTRTYGPKGDTPEAALEAAGLMEVKG